MPDLTRIKPYAVEKIPQSGDVQSQTDWQNGVMERYIVLADLSLLIGAGIAWQFNDFVD